jgi:hypothetical protein
MTAPRPNRFATIPIYADSTGKELMPGNAVSVGDFDPIADSEARKRALDARERELHELEHQLVEWDAALHEQRVRMDSEGAARRDAIKHGLIRDVLSKLDALAARIDSLEERQRANDPELQITLPPGTDAADAVSDIADEGELQALKEPNHQYLDPNPDPVEPQPPDPPELVDDGDEGPGDLPNELTEKVPPITGTAPEFPGPREPTARNPVGTNW